MTMFKPHEVEITPLENERFNFLVKCKTCPYEGRVLTEAEAKVLKNQHIQIRSIPAW